MKEKTIQVFHEKFLLKVRKGHSCSNSAELRKEQRTQRGLPSTEALPWATAATAPVRARAAKPNRVHFLSYLLNRNIPGPQYLQLVTNKQTKH